MPRPQAAPTRHSTFPKAPHNTVGSASIAERLRLASLGTGLAAESMMRTFDYFAAQNTVAV